MISNIAHQIITEVGKLDNGSHSSNQLQGVDEKIVNIVFKEIKEEIDVLQKQCNEADGIIDGITVLHILRDKVNKG